MLSKQQNNSLINDNTSIGECLIITFDIKKVLLDN